MARDRKHEHDRALKYDLTAYNALLESNQQMDDKEYRETHKKGTPVEGVPVVKPSNTESKVHAS